MLALALRGIGLGFTAGVSPGPLQTYLIGATLAMGWRKSILIIFTPLLTDVPLIVLVVFVLGAIPAVFIRLLQLFGGVFLLWIAYGGWKQWRAGPANVAEAAPVQARRRTVGRAMTMNWLSPGPYIFWATINGPLLIEGLSHSAWHGLAFLLGFYGTFIVLLAATVLIFDRLRALDPRITRAISLITIIILVVFGLSLLGQGVGIIT